MQNNLLLPNKTLCLYIYLSLSLSLSLYIYIYIYIYISIYIYIYISHHIKLTNNLKSQLIGGFSASNANFSCLTRLNNFFSFSFRFYKWLTTNFLVQHCVLGTEGPCWSTVPCIPTQH